MRQLQERMQVSFEDGTYRLKRTIDSPGACGEPATVTVELLLPGAQGSELIKEVKQRFKVEISTLST